MTQKQELKLLKAMKKQMDKDHPQLFANLDALYIFAVEHKKNAPINWAKPNHVLFTGDPG